MDQQKCTTASVPRWPDLTWRRDLPFRLGTTSFMVPAGYVENVKFLAGRLDDVELLFFESHDRSPLPSSADIDQLRRLARDHDLSYTVHLPLDIALGAVEESRRRRSVERCRRVIELTAPLAPHSYVVHFQPAPDQGDLAAWQAALHRSVRELLGTGVEARRLCVETLHYPVAWLEEMVEGHDLSLCLDVGHLFVARPGELLPAEGGKARWRVVHLHGVRRGRDHRSLAESDRAQREAMGTVLRRLTERPRPAVVTVEVFAWSALLESLPVLEAMVPWQS